MANFIANKCKDSHILNIIDSFLKEMSHNEGIPWEKNLSELVIKLAKEFDVHRTDCRPYHLFIAELVMDQVS